MLRHVLSVFKREFRAYFNSPVAYVFLVAFLALVGFLTFSVAGFYEIRQANLAPFFFWHPWVYLLLVPAATMGLWADERRNGTAELVLTLPLTPREILLGKFLAAWAFLATALALTFPILFTVGYLGDPDWGTVACGYFGSLLLAGAASAIGLFASTLSRSSVVGFVIALVIVFFFLIIGFDPVIGTVSGWGVPAAVTDLMAASSLLFRFEALRRGVIDLADVGYYLAMIAVFLVAARTVTDSRRGSAKGVVALALTAAIAVAAEVILAELTLRRDFTAERLYTLSDGSREVLAQLEDDVTFKFFASSSESGMPRQLKDYATKVGNLLKEYERAAGGRLAIETYDPAPDSDAEEWAQRYGVEPQQSGPFGPALYLGIVAVSGDREETLGVLSPRTETTLEYDLTRLITRVAWPERPTIGVMTSLKGVFGEGGWTAFSELKRDYTVREIATDATVIDPAVKTLVLLHAKDLSDATLYAIDQFVLGGGKLIACVDPLSVCDLESAGAAAGRGGDGPSTLGKLFDAWGVKFDTSRIVCDYGASTRLGDGRGGAEVNPAFLSLGSRHMAGDDLLVARLSNVMMPFAGALEFTPAEGALEFTPVVSSAKDSSAFTDRMSLMYGAASSAAADGEAKVLVARLKGVFKSAFPKGPDGTNDVANALSEGKSAVLLVGDSDFLADRFAIQLIRTPLGQLPQLINENFTLFTNFIEQFAGREELIGLRSRGVTDRPFTVVNELEAAATKKWQEKEARFQEELRATQQRLSALQAQKSANERLVLSRAQQDEIARLRKAQSATRRQLKLVRRELTADIDALGKWLKFDNIVLVPLLVVLFGLFRGWRRRCLQAR